MSLSRITLQPLNILKPLEEVDPRVVVVPLSGFSWTTYNELDARGLFDDIVKKEWEEEGEYVSLDLASVFVS